MLSKIALCADNNGYTNSCGTDDCRNAIATSAGAEKNDVFVTAGCSQVLLDLL